MRSQVELHDEDDSSHEFELHETDVLHLEDWSSDVRKVGERTIDGLDT